jgi:hypothetical protein
VIVGLVHYPNHPTAVLTMLPYYIGVAAVYGGLTSRTVTASPTESFT